VKNQAKDLIKRRRHNEVFFDDVAVLDHVHPYCPPG
jgi:hypothetical protein